MKRILNPTGGRPLKNEDAQLFQQLVDMFEGVFADVPEITSFIISGCEISGTPGNYTVTEGYIYYDGSICYYAGGTGLTLPLAMEKVVTNTTPREFFDGIIKNAIEYTTIVAQIGGGFSLTTTTERIGSYFKDLLDNYNNPTWLNPTFNAGFSANVTNPFQYRLNRGKLEFRGAIDSVSDTTGNAFTLPVGYRPIQQADIVMVKETAGFNLSHCIIRTDGLVFSGDWELTASGTNVLNASIIID